jgi:hypothetical protein
MPVNEPSIGRGALLSLGIYVASLPVSVIFLIGPLLSITLVPYLSSAIGTRFVRPKGRLPLALMCALIWSSIETALLISIMRVAANMTPMGFNLERIGIALIVLIWLSNMAFGSLGAVHPWKDPFSGPGEEHD